MASSNKKIDAIYALREAAESKALAQHALATDPSVHNRNELLDAQLKLEETTMAAIEVCHECGHSHASGTPHRSPAADNVIQLADRRDEVTRQDTSG
jgi:hypothetical protein